MSFSADGCGEVFEYLRRGHKWQSFLHTVDSINQSLKKYPGESFSGVTYCLQVSNSKIYKDYITKFNNLS